MASRLNRILYLVCVLSDFAAFIVVFMVSRGLAEQQVEAWYLGLIGAGYSFSAGVGSILAGLLAHRFDGRIVFVGGAAATVVMIAACGLGNPGSAWFLTRYCLLGVALSFQYPPIIAWLNQGEDPHANHVGVSRTLIIYCIAWNVGLMAGQLTAGSLFSSGLGWAYGTALVAAAINLILAFFAAREVASIARSSSESPVPLPEISPLADSFKRLGWIANLGGMFGGSLVIHLLPELAVDLGVRPENHGMILASWRVVIIATYLVMHVVPFWHYRFSTSVVSQGVAVGGLVVIATAGTATMLFVGLVLLGQLVGYNYFSGVYYSTAGSVQERRVLSAGVHEATLAGGMAVGTILGGFAGSWVSHRAPYWLAAAVMLVLIAVQTVAWIRWVRPIPWARLKDWTLLCFVASIFAGHCAVRADDWPQWRGPRRDGVSAETGLLRAWPPGGPKLARQAGALGSGYSSVVVGGGRVVTMGRRDSDVVVSALDEATLSPLWTQTIGTTSRTPCSTPTLDGDRLFALDPDGDLACLDAATGKILWQRSFVGDFGGVMMSGRGYGESPLVDGERLIVTPGGPEAALVALDKQTGDVVWKAQLPEIGAAGRDGAGFSSMVVTEAAGVRQYVQLVGRGVVGIDARDGRFLWGYNAIANQTANIPTPLVHNDFVFSANGYTSGSVLLRLVPRDPTAATTSGVKAETVYSLTAAQFQNHHGGVVRIGAFLYGGHGNNNGMPTCVELATGRMAWKRRGPGVGSAAVTAADDRLYFRYQNGIVALIAATEQGYQLEGTLEIPGAGGDSWAHPVIANGHLYLREQERLWGYDLRADAAPVPATEATSTLLTDDPAARALREIGVRIERILPAASKELATQRGPIDSAAIRPRAERSIHPRFYELALEPKEKEENRPPHLAIVTDAQLNPDGSLIEGLADPLGRLPGPFVVSLAGTTVSDNGLRALGRLDRLVGLNLELCSRITDAGLESVAALKRLRVLILAGTGVMESGIQRLTETTSLVALDLEGCDGVADAACQPLGAISTLRALRLKKTGFERNRITDAGLQRLSGLANLEILTLYGNAVTDAGVAHLQPLSKLRELDLSLLPLTDAGLIHLQPLRELERLDLLFSEGFAGPTLSDAGMESLNGLTKLRALDLTGSKLTDAGLAQLARLRNLKLLELVRTGVSAAGVMVFRNSHPDCKVSR